MNRKDFLKKTLKIALSQRLENVQDLNQVDNRLEIDPNVTDTESQTCKPCKEALRDLGYSATCAGFRQLEEDKRNFKKSCIHTGSEDDYFSLCKMAWEKAMEEIPKSDSYHEEWWEEELEEAIKTIDKIEEFKDDFSHFSYESSW